MNNLVIIHVGKCGGSNVCSELESKMLNFPQYILEMLSMNQIEIM